MVYVENEGHDAGNSSSFYIVLRPRVLMSWAGSGAETWQKGSYRRGTICTEAAAGLKFRPARGL